MTFKTAISLFLFLLLLPGLAQSANFDSVTINSGDAYLGETLRVLVDYSIDVNDCSLELQTPSGTPLARAKNYTSRCESFFCTEASEFTYLFDTDASGYFFAEIHLEHPPLVVDANYVVSAHCGSDTDKSQSFVLKPKRDITVWASQEYNALTDSNNVSTVVLFGLNPFFWVLLLIGVSLFVVGWRLLKWGRL